MQKNVFGEPLKLCSASPITGWYRDGYLNTDSRDVGSHTVCATMTAEFLNFSRSVGNDLSTPHLPHFPGLVPGDRWGLCAGRWFEAFQAGFAPRVYLEATNEAALRIVPLNILQRYDDRIQNGTNGHANGHEEL